MAVSSASKCSAHVPFMIFTTSMVSFGRGRLGTPPVVAWAAGPHTSLVIVDEQEPAKPLSGGSLSTSAFIAITREPGSPPL